MKILLAITDTSKFCGKLRITLRGHRDKSKYPEYGKVLDNLGVGNFIHINNYAIRTDPGNKILENYLEACSKCETYISPKTQNDLLKYCYHAMTENLISEIKNGNYYTLKLDETRDILNNEQLSLKLSSTNLSL